MSKNHPFEAGPRDAVEPASGTESQDTLRDAPTEELATGFTPQAAPPGRQGDTGPLRVGEVFNSRYRVLETVGHGGFCHVYRAEDLDDGVTVALKLLHKGDASPTVIPRMQRELRLARDLGHPNIVKVHELIETDGQHCLVMDFVEGRTLKQLVAETRPVPAVTATEMFLELTSAVAAVHASEIVHRDLKPQNVMVNDAGRVQLLDFGLAKTSDSTGLTATGTILGTPDYMSPEQVNGDAADSRSDVYSLGVIAWELFTGETPFSGDSPIAVALQHVQSRVPSLADADRDVPPAIVNLVERMTDRDPRRRPASAEDVLFELERNSASGLSAPNRRSSSVRRWGLVAASVAAAVGIGLGINASRSPGTGDPFADGTVVVAVQPRAEARGAAVERRLFLESVAETIPSTWAGPEIFHLELDDNLLPNPRAAAARGAEHLIEVSFDEDSESPRLKLRVFSTADGSLWWEAGITDEVTLDYSEMVAVSRRLADQYADRVSRALHAARSTETEG